MPVFTDFTLVRYEDSSININMNPAVGIGGWEIHWRLTKRFGSSSGLINKYCASGFNGVSGITITNSGLGKFRIDLNAGDTSGLETGNYAFTASRLSSGYQTVLNQGYLMLTDR